MNPLFTEYLLAAVITEEELEGFTTSPCIVELRAMQGERGAPAYQVVKSSLTEQRTLYRSRIYDSLHYAAADYARVAGVWPRSGRSA